MKKTILILGAGWDQLHIIKTAKKMDLKIVVCDQNTNAPGFDIAYHKIYVSTRDIDKLKIEIDRYIKTGGEINGVTTMGSDIPNIVSELSSYYGT